MGMEQAIRTGLGHRGSPVSYRHNFLFFIYITILVDVQIH